MTYYDDPLWWRGKGWTYNGSLYYYDPFYVHGTPCWTFTGMSQFLIETYEKLSRDARN